MGQIKVVIGEGLVIWSHDLFDTKLRVVFTHNVPFVQ